MDHIRTACLGDDAGQTPGNAAPIVVELHGDIDGDAAEPLWDSLISGSERRTDVLVDLSDVTLLDGASLSTLVRAGHLAERRGCRLCLVAPAAQVRRTLAATGLEDVFPILQDRREALCPVR